MSTSKKVKTIPAIKPIFTDVKSTEIRKRRVAAYARVSTDEDDQLNSYEAQVDYYENYIKGHDDWEFVKIFSDEGITGTSTKHRDGFKAMIEVAMRGDIDLIVTKSVSRFARNTVDSLTAIRKLKEKGVEVYFEKENIWTFDSKGEVLITIMSSLAQDESRNISENTTWGVRKSFQDGKAQIPFSKFLGYDKGEDGSFVINPEQAKTVQLIYKLYLEGLSCHSIKKELTARKIPTPTGKEQWNIQTVKSILTNEKYKGDALLQKHFTVDFLEKKMKKNEGEIPQYYVEGHHEPIIDPATFELVQHEMERRKQSKYRYSGVSIFSSKIKCGECGCWYGKKVWHSNESRRKVVYQCNNKYKGDVKCRTPYVTEDEIKNVFVKALNLLLSEKDELIANAKAISSLLCEDKDLLERKNNLSEELNRVTKAIESSVYENARVSMIQEEYRLRYQSLVEQFSRINKEYEAVDSQITDRKVRKEIIEQFIHDIESQELINSFDEELWTGLVDFVTVYDKDDIRVTFKDGTEIRG
ncbi:MAG: recombinase family protein [Oscillospiraceae bacterium]|nr:recombinase family protein [Oscillospiraceae bacterium]